MNNLEIFAIVFSLIFMLFIACAIIYAIAYSIKSVRDMVKLYRDAHTHLWTPIEEGLPEEDVRVIVALKHYNSYTKIDTDRILNGQWVRWEGSITHWTELPELPKESEDER